MYTNKCNLINKTQNSQIHLLLKKNAQNNVLKLFFIVQI